MMAVVVVILLGCGSRGCDAHNITQILSQHPSFSTFNHYLTLTHLAGEINRRRTITVCVVDNAAMDTQLLNKNFSLAIITNILSLHIFADYFGASKLHQMTQGYTTTSSLFQASGHADGTSGYVNITDIKGGKVGFSPLGLRSSDPPMATFVNSVEESPYDLAVIQISHVLSSPEAEEEEEEEATAPVTADLMNVMAEQGCKDFSDLIAAEKGVEDAFRESLRQGGLTLFCPSGEKLKSFMPNYRALPADAKMSLLLYHGLPVYNSLGKLRSNNGVANTLATKGADKRFDFSIRNDGDDVKLQTQVVTATITGTLIDQNPLSIFKIDQVLQPGELSTHHAQDSHAAADERSSSAATKTRSTGGVMVWGSLSLPTVLLPAILVPLNHL